MAPSHFLTTHLARTMGRYLQQSPGRIDHSINQSLFFGNCLGRGEMRAGGKEGDKTKRESGLGKLQTGWGELERRGYEGGREPGLGKLQASWGERERRGYEGERESQAQERTKQFARASLLHPASRSPTGATAAQIHTNKGVSWPRLGQDVGYGLKYGFGATGEGKGSPKITGRSACPALLVHTSRYEPRG